MPNPCSITNLVNTSKGYPNAREKKKFINIYRDKTRFPWVCFRNLDLITHLLGIYGNLVSVKNYSKTLFSGIFFCRLGLGVFFFYINSHPFCYLVGKKISSDLNFFFPIVSLSLSAVWEELQLYNREIKIIDRWQKFCFLFQVCILQFLLCFHFLRNFLIYALL